LVLGVDVEKPFAVSKLRAAALAAVGRGAEAGDDFVVVDPPLRRAINAVDGAAARAGGVLITGPTGVGKERLARRVHERSGRAGAFVPINCGALVEGLAESTLFGHARGAFTGAVASAPGAFVEAHRGTLFLDEVGELDLRIQAKLLRALEDGTVRPLGASKPARVDIRIVAATNRDLRGEIAVGRFRADLYYRLATFVVEVPALSARPGDLGALLDHIVAKHDRGSVVSLAAPSRAALERYPWPGNARELKNVVERVFALAPAGVLSLEGLLRLAPELLEARADAKSGALARSEQQCIVAAIEGSAGSRQKAAADLGIHRSTLWRKMQRLGLSAGAACKSR
jgi:transcriptional regulator with PAS, ATPase and Fis domain